MSDRDEDDEDDTPRHAASDVVIIAYGRDDDERAEYIDRIQGVMEEMGAVRIDREDDNQISCKLTDDVLTMLDEIAGWAGDPSGGTLVQAGVIDDNGDFIPISHAWETWEELLDDVEEQVWGGSMSKSTNREAVHTFAISMIAELDANDHKGGWQHCSIGYLTRRLGNELAELRAAIRRKEPGARIRSEAADIANFAMMIADRYRDEQ